MNLLITICKIKIMNKTINFWIFGISILLLGTSLFLNISASVITNESIVLVFVGILATFIVVGNFAQVSEIKNSTDKQIRNLESKTQSKIDELNTLFNEINEATNKLSKIEKDTCMNSGEAYRLYGIYTLDKNHYKTSTTHLINAVTSYNKAGKGGSFMNTILDVILGSLEPENWNHKDSTEDFDYKLNISRVQKFPDSYQQKQKIIDMLENYKLGIKKE